MLLSYWSIMSTTLSSPPSPLFLKGIQSRIELHDFTLALHYLATQPSLHLLYPSFHSLGLPRSATAIMTMVATRAAGNCNTIGSLLCGGGWSAIERDGFYSMVHDLRWIILALASFWNHSDLWLLSRFVWIIAGYSRGRGYPAQYWCCLPIAVRHFPEHTKITHACKSKLNISKKFT